MDLQNTPGFYFAIAYWIMALILSQVSRRRVKGPLRFILNLLFFILITGFMVLTDGVRKALFLPCFAVIILLICLHMYIHLDHEPLVIGFGCPRLFIDAELTASLAWQIYYITGKPEVYGVDPVMAGILMVITYSLCSALFYKLEKYLHRNFSFVPVRRMDLVFEILLAILIFSISNWSYVDSNGLFSGRTITDVFIIRTLVDMCGAALLYAFLIQLKSSQIRFEMDAMQNLMELQSQNYELNRNTIDLINQKYHDLKHQILLLKSSEQDEKKAYLEQMERDIQIYENQFQTGSKILDTVLTAKGILARGRGIEFKCMADGRLLSFMEDMDLNALFGNMLDNAMESVMKLEDPEKRLISVLVSRDRDFVRVRVENYCEEAIEFKNGIPQTTKKDKNLHGFGIRSIQAIAEKYDGSVLIELEDNWFIVKLLFPV